MNYLGNAGVAAFLIVSSGTTSPWLPNPTLTPGAINPAITQANISQTICRKGWSTKSIRPPVSYTNRLKRQQIAQYGYADKNMRDYEEDHRIPLEAGGNPTSPQNLWPQPRHGVWSASKKDQLENWAHRQICAGKMTLSQGRALFFGNWVDAYQQYLLPHVAAH